MEQLKGDLEAKTRFLDQLKGLVNERRLPSGQVGRAMRRYERRTGIHVSMLELIGILDFSYLREALEPIRDDLERLATYSKERLPEVLRMQAEYELNTLENQ
ncbi:MAG TPA: hypothetical protein VJJ52_02990 [Candidatus Nanoarchaeia archaeon]|nr:hypothetical protein [Candidatus Nanoarchaeia archaeon]